MDASFPRLSDLHTQHPHAVRAMQSAMASDRIPHAYLFGGRSEAALRRLSWVWSATLLCLRRGPYENNACGQCASCIQMPTHQHPDVIHVGGSGTSDEPDRPDDAAESRKQTMGVGMIRDMRPRAMLTAALGHAKVVLIEGADRLTTEAQNGLLKILEEPAPATFFVMWSTRPKHILLTVRSRCQRVHVAAPSPHASHASLIHALQIDSALARCLVPIAGDDVGYAQYLVDHGAKETLAALHKVLYAPIDDVELLRIAADLSADKDSTHVALALLEICVRDHLAEQHGADVDLLYSGALTRTTRVSTRAWEKAARELAQLRVYQHHNLNRTLVLEHMLMLLAREVWHRHE